MRWKLLAVLALLIAVQVPAAHAQTTGVPVTMTMLADSLHHPADSVKFYLPNGTYIGLAQEKGDTTYQKTVGLVGPDTDGRYRLRAEIYSGMGNPRDFPFSFGPADQCFNVRTPPHTGQIVRVACTLVKQGNGLVCEAIYEGMDDPLPDCHSRQCILCGGDRVCGSNPVCN